MVRRFTVGLSLRCNLICDSLAFTSLLFVTKPKALLATRLTPILVRLKQKSSLFVSYQHLSNQLFKFLFVNKSQKQ